MSASRSFNMSSSRRSNMSSSRSSNRSPSRSSSRSRTGVQTGFQQEFQQESQQEFKQEFQESFKHESHQDFNMSSSMSSKRIESFILSQWFWAGGKIELFGYVEGIIFCCYLAPLLSHLQPKHGPQKVQEKYVFSEKTDLANIQKYYQKLPFGLPKVAHV